MMLAPNPASPAEIDVQVKALQLMVSVVGPILAGIVALALFFWRDARNRQIQRMVSCRSLVLLANLVSEYLRIGQPAQIDIGSNLWISQCDALVREKGGLNIAVSILQIVAEAKKVEHDKIEGSLVELRERIHQVKLQAESLYAKRQRSIIAILLIAR